MTITMWKVSKLRNGETSKSEEHDLRPGYNEFYLPSVGPNEELWVKVTSDHERDYTLHLKR